MTYSIMNQHGATVEQKWHKKAGWHTKPLSIYSEHSTKPLEGPTTSYAYSLVSAMQSKCLALKKIAIRIALILACNVLDRGVKSMNAY